MKTVRLWRLVVAAAFATALLFPVGAQPAGAWHNANCDAGDMCIWGEDWHSGCVFTYPYDVNGLNSWTWFNCSPSTASPHNGANSFKNRGNSCNIAFYDWNNQSGGYRTANREGLGGWWQDGNLGDNYWDGSTSGSSGTVVEDDMQSWEWC